MQTAKDHVRAARADARALRDAARDAARHARAAGDAEVQQLIEEVEEMIGRVGDVLDPETLRLRERVTDAVANTRRALAAGSAQVRHRAGEAWTASDHYVRGKPWEAVGAAALLGVALGFLLFRRN